MLRRDKNYNPELDKQAKVPEMRSLYKAITDGRAEEDAGRVTVEAC